MQSLFPSICKQARTVIGSSLPWIVVVLLSGCAYAPGMYIGSTPVDESKPKSNFWSITAGRNAVDSTVVAENSPVSALIPITTELIRSQRTSQSTQIPAGVKRFFGISQPYQISPGDILNIMVWDHPELNIPVAAVSASTETPAGYNVNSKGFIQFPYIGSIKLNGLTEQEARDLIFTRLSKYYKDPQVTVRMQSYRGSKVYVDGEVRTPGLQYINDAPMTLPELIGRAGGFSSTADRSTIEITRDNTTTIINVSFLIEIGVNPSRILLKGGDLVRVLSRDESKVFVLGEVLKPTTQVLRNGHLTLSEALGDSGGVNPISGDPRQIFVVRAAGKATEPEIYHLDASTPMAYALAEGFELKPRDVIYVDPVPLVRWNRVISLVLPSAQAVSTTRSVTN